MKAGAVEVLTKPFNDDVLLSTIQQCIEHSRVVLREQAEMSVLREMLSMASTLFPAVGQVSRRI